MANATITFYINDETPGFRPTQGMSMNESLDAQPCPLVVGDTVSFPNHRNRVYRVVARHCNAGADLGEAEWLIRLEPVRSAR